LNPKRTKRSEDVLDIGLRRARLGCLAWHSASCPPSRLLERQIQARCRRSLQCLYGSLDVAVCNEAFQNGIPDCSGKALRVHSDASGINKGPKRRRNTESITLFDFVGSKTVPVKHDDWRWCLAKPGRNRHVDLGRHQIADLMHRQRALVGNNCSAPTPQCPANEIFVRTPGPLPEAIDATVFPNPVATPGLSSRKIAALGNCIFVEASPCFLLISSPHCCIKVTSYMTLVKIDHLIIN